MSPSNNGMSSHSLRLFHHLIASFILAPTAVAVIVIPAVRTEGGLADISSFSDTDWPRCVHRGYFL